MTEAADGERTISIFVPRETAPRERRVALVPQAIERLDAERYRVRVVSGAGEEAGLPDEAYREAGAEIVPDLGGRVSAGDVVLAVQAQLGPPAANGGSSDDEPAGSSSSGLSLEDLPSGSFLIGLLRPLDAPESVRAIAEQGVSAFAMELIPRITRAQPMDALSSQSTAAGYKAVLAAADALPRFFPMLMTAAGTVPPAKVLVLGAGVAGLQAIATARRLGAVVQGYDIRPAVKEQVESLGATYVGLQQEEAETEGGYAKEQTDEDRERAKEHLHGLVAAADVVITTALVPGRPAPRLVPTAMVEDMRSGSVVVDLAAEAGGNCELTECGRTVVHNGVHIIGMDDGASGIAADASRLYAKNVVSLLEHLQHEGELRFDPDDEISAACCVAHGGEVVNDRVKDLLEG